jgi:hypothetical protein
VVDLPPTPVTACGLALALPMDFSAVEAAASGGAYADYVGRAVSFGSVRRIWEQGFDKVSVSATALESEARRLGAVVAADASLEDLYRLFNTCAVVTVVAHWRGPEIDASDIKIEPKLFIDRLDSENSETADLIRAVLPPNWKSQVLRATETAAQKSRLAELLDKRMRHEPYIVAVPEDIEWHMDAITLRHANREALDGWWPEALACGNRLELSDGLHSAQSIAACVPNDWRGVADLSNCQSAQLIECIKQARSDRIVIANEQETNPIRRMALLCVVYELLAKSPCNYAEARVALSEAMVARTGAERRYE